MNNQNENEQSIQPGLNELISLTQASELSGLTSDHLRRLVREGDLWGKKIGRNWVTTEMAIREYLAHDHKPGPKPMSGLDKRKLG
jgi:hypothetical protein